MNVNEPDSLVCWSDRMIVRVSPLATADSVEFGTSQAATNAVATASCAVVRPRLVVTLKPANNRSFPNTARPAAKPANCAFRTVHLRLAGLSPAGPYATCRARVPLRA
jgi:hypothetical protein